jgi:Tol biopolymer transport system component
LLLAHCAPAHAPRARGGASFQDGGPERFGEGVFTTGAWDFFVALQPGTTLALLCRANGSFTHFTILETERRGGRWAAPRVASFSGRWSDADPHFTADGQRVYFISNRPVSGDSAAGEYDVWFVDRTAAGWGEPKRLEGPVNGPRTEWSPSIANSNNLYFGTVRDGGRGGNDLYVALWTGSGYAEPENLGDSINTARGEVEPWIAPDESYLIFSGQNRADGAGGFDLYVSERRGGVWQKARPLASLNTGAYEFNPSVSPDGHWLFFSSTRSAFDAPPPAKPLGYDELQSRLLSPGNGLGDIYRVDVRELGLAAVPTNAAPRAPS